MGFARYALPREIFLVLVLQNKNALSLSRRPFPSSRLPVDSLVFPPQLAEWLVDVALYLRVDEPTGAGPALLLAEGVGAALAEGEAPAGAGAVGVTPSRASCPCRA